MKQQQCDINVKCMSVCVCMECMLCLASVGMCQLPTANVTFASTPHIPLQINTPSHLTRLTPTSSYSSTCFIAMCFMHCTLFSLLRLVYIINSNSKGNSNNNIASSAQAQHLTYPCLFLLLMKKVVPLIIICHCIRMCAAIEIQLRICVNVCMCVCDSSSRCRRAQKKRKKKSEERESGGERE